MKRRSFSEKQIRMVFEAQGGLCANPECRRDLRVTGFHVHHKDGNPNNIRISNCELLCPECHHQTFGKKDEFSELTDQAIENLKVLIEKGLSKELSGAHMERILDAIELLQKLAYHRYREGAQKIPPSEEELRKQIETDIYLEAYRKGFEEGLRIGAIARKSLLYPLWQE